MWLIIIIVLGCASTGCIVVVGENNAINTRGIEIDLDADDNRTEVENKPNEAKK